MTGEGESGRRVSFNFYRHAGILFHFGSFECSNLAVCFSIVFLCVIIRPISSQPGTTSVLFHRLPNQCLPFSSLSKYLVHASLYCCVLWTDASSSSTFQRAIRGSSASSAQDSFWTYCRDERGKGKGLNSFCSGVVVLPYFLLISASLAGKSLKVAFVFLRSSNWGGKHYR